MWFDKARLCTGLRYFLTCVAPVLVGCQGQEETAGGGEVQRALRVLVHEGGPRFTRTQPELLSVALLKTDGAVMTGRLLEAPRELRLLAVGDTIKFLQVPGRPHPILVTDRYLMERRHSYVVGCDKCGFSELFDSPSDLAAATFPGQVVSTFTARCPLCGGGQLVRLLPSTPSTPRDAPEKQVASVVRSVVAAQLGKEGPTIAFDQSLRSLGADELDQVEIVFALEEHFVVCIPDKRLGDISTMTLNELTKTVMSILAEHRDNELLNASG